MRSLAIRLILWLCQRYDVWPLQEARVAMGSDAKARSERWEVFAREDGGLFDMIEALRRETFEKASEIPPEEVEKLQYAAMSDRNLRRLKAKVQSIIASGKIEAQNEANLARMNAPQLRKSVI